MLGKNIIFGSCIKFLGRGGRGGLTFGSLFPTIFQIDK